MLKKVVESSRGIPKLCFEDAAVKLYKMGVRTQQDFRNIKKAGKRPAELPAAPDIYYPEFEGWGTFVELGKMLAKDVKEDELATLLTYSELKSIIVELKISTKYRYDVARAAGKMGMAPADPSIYKEFKSWDDLLFKEKRFLDYKDAKKVVAGFGLKTSIEWRVFCREGNRPHNIPALPDKYYENFSWSDFLSVKKSKIEVQNKAV